MRSKIFVFILIFAISGNLFVFSQGPTITSEKKRDIVKLFDLMGTKDNMVKVFDSVIDRFKLMAPSVPEKYWKQFKQEMSYDKLEEKIIPIYDKHLSHADVKEMIKFYNTPTGKKLARVLPDITIESMEVGMEWGQEIAEKILKRLEDDGYINTEEPVGK